MSNYFYNKQNNYSDVKRLISFVNSAKIVSEKQALALLEKIGLDEKRINGVINILKRNNFVSFTESGKYIISNSISRENAMSLFDNIEKINWLFVDLSKYYNSINFDCKYPCKAFIYNVNTGDSINVFEIRKDRISRDINVIDTNFSTKNSEISPIDSIFFIEDADEIDEIFLPETLNVMAFATLTKDDNGCSKIIYYDSNKNRMEIV